MERTVSATHARTNLGELMRWTVEHGAPVILERSGKPYVVLLSLEVYQQLLADQNDQPDWRELVQRARDQVRSELRDRPLPSPEEIIREMREERDVQLMDLR
jgi:prevent-host-death family protein